MRKRWARMSDHRRYKPGDIAKLAQTFMRIYYQAKAKLMIDELLPMMKRRKISMSDFPPSFPCYLGILAYLVRLDLVTKAIARKVLGVMPHDGERTPAQIIIDNGWTQLSKRDEIAPLVDAAMHENPKAVQDYRGGKKQAANTITGAVMRMCGGRADPEVLNDVLEERLNG